MSANDRTYKVVYCERTDIRAPNADQYARAMGYVLTEGVYSPGGGGYSTERDAAQPVAYVYQIAVKYTGDETSLTEVRRREFFDLPFSMTRDHEAHAQRTAIERHDGLVEHIGKKWGAK